MTAPQEWLLQGTGIGLARGGRKILVNVDFTLNRGEILTVIGPNGAGKTTLLRLALGLIAPTTGQIKRQPSLTIGYMPQKLHLDATFPLTVRRFLSSARSKIPTDQLVAALTETGVPHLLEASMQTLSGGETQRVLLARTLLRQPDLLVLDEPVQGVDINGQVELYRLIGQIRDRHRCGILMVSHDLHLVMAATDRVICIDQHICCSGTPATISSDPTYIRMYGQLALYQHDQIHHQQHRSNRDV